MAWNLSGLAYVCTSTGSNTLTRINNQHIKHYFTSLLINILAVNKSHHFWEKRGRPIFTKWSLPWCFESLLCMGVYRRAEITLLNGPWYSTPTTLSIFVNHFHLNSFHMLWTTSHANKKPSGVWCFFQLILLSGLAELSKIGYTFVLYTSCTRHEHRS